jgi:hypothetical protein
MMMMMMMMIIIIININIDIEGVGSPETSKSLYQCTWRHIISLLTYSMEQSPS